MTTKEKLALAVYDCEFTGMLIPVADARKYYNRAVREYSKTPCKASYVTLAHAAQRLLIAYNHYGE